METGRNMKRDMILTHCHLIQKNKKSVLADLSGRKYIDLLMSAVMVCLFDLSLTGILTDSYGVSYNSRIFFIISLIYSVLFSAYYGTERLKKKGIRRTVLILVMITVVLWVIAWQNYFMAGIRGVGNDMINRLNHSYGGRIEMLTNVGNENNQLAVLLLINFFITWMIARAIVDKRDNLRLLVFVFPVIIISAIGGGKISMSNMVIMVLTFMIITVLAGIRKRPKLWGGMGHEDYNDNQEADRNIRFKSIIWNTLIFLLLGMTSVRLIEPALSVPLESLSDMTYETRLSGLRFLGEYVPKLTDGKLKFSVEGVGGGVSGGILGELQGTFYTMKENVKVTCSSLPKETIYLKGFVGTEYQGRSWEWHDEKGYKEVLTHWDTEGKAENYIYNLPFLRMVYAMNQMADSEQVNGSELSLESGFSVESDEIDGADRQGENPGEPDYITVERMNENISYTYVPYQSFINDYYHILGGDCCIEGQSDYEDTFAWFPTSDYKNVMEKYRSYLRNGNSYGLLDEVEATYNYYVEAQDTKTGDVDLSGLMELCKEKAQEWDEKILPDMTAQQKDDLIVEKYDDVINFVRRTLWERCEFEAEAKKLPEGKDFINYFMFEIKVGDSTAFASTAVMMFRMCGIPARYVEGYVVPVNIFSVNENDEYYAVLQDDNAHAWAEIYVPYQGWTPVETTPGFDGTISNLEMPNAEEEQKEQKEINNDKEQKQHLEKNRNENDRKRQIVFYLVMSIGLISLILSIRHAVIFRVRRGKIGSLDTNEKVKRIFYSYYDALIFDGFDEDIDTTSSAFGNSIIEKYPKLSKREVFHYLSIVLNCHYGQNVSTDKEAEFSLEMYETLLRNVYKNLKIKDKIIFKVWKAF